MEEIGKMHLNITCTNKRKKMIKKLLKNIFSSFTFDYDRKKIESYLAKSSDLADLERRMKELDQRGTYNKFYI
tara:strand:+ start:3985 stop:4203 length:219 start_codon:yes stop_codon:yes gene_type:complete